MKLLKNTQLRIFLIGILLTTLSFFVDNYFVQLIMLIQSSFFIKLFSFITVVGNLEFFIPIAIVITLFLFAKKKKISGFLITIAGVGFISYLLKFIINRSRPFQSQHIASLITVTESSFPSGHAMIIFSIVPILAKNFPKEKYYFYIFAVLVAFSRVYLNVHYLSDVVAGGFLGYLIGKIFSELEDKYHWI